MSERALTDSGAESERLDMAAGQAIAACDGDLRATIKALIVANEYLEAQISKEYARGYREGCDFGRWKTYSG